MRNKKLLGVLLSLGVLPFMPSMVDIVQAENKQVPATFEVTEDIVGGGLVVTIPDSLDMTKADNGWYTSSGTVTAKGNINPSKRLKVSTDLSVTYAHKDKVGLGVLANVEFGTKGVSYFSVDELKANLTSPETKKVPVTTKVESSDIQYLGEYKSDIVFQVSVVDTEEDFSGYFTYKTYENTDKLVINGYSQEGYEKLGKKGNVELSIPLPSSYKGQEVIGVEFDASSDINRIELVEGASMPTQHWVMPDNYTVFKCFSNYANGMEKLKSITLTDGLVELGEGALQGVILEELIIPKGLKTLNSPAVLKGATIDVINFEEGFTEIAGDLLKGVTCRELNLPNSLVHITHNFLDGSSIEQLYLGENINYNEGYFYDESSSGYVFLTSEDWENFQGLQYTNLGAKGVKTLRINVKNLETNFQWDYDAPSGFVKEDVFITGVDFDTLIVEGIRDERINEFDDRCGFSLIDSSNITNLILKPEHKKIGQRVFYWAYDEGLNIENLIISDEVEEMTVLFNDCLDGAKIKNIVLPKNLKVLGEDLGDNAGNCTWYGGCFKYVNFTGVASLNLQTLEYLGDNVFYSCKGIEAITLSDKIETIGYGCFREMPNLKSIRLPNNLNYIGSYAFEYCTLLEDVQNYNSNISLGDYVFTGCPFQPE